MLQDLIESMLQGNEVALAKLISQVENRDLGREIIPLIHKQANSSYTIGITGPPGVGKSTLTEKLVLRLIKDNSKVGILAIDPTSPFSGGALLGDRIRLQQLSTNPLVYIRSMASRGYLGGISAATLDAAKILEAYGCDYIIIETVGVGQSEVEIVQHVDSTLLILSPGLGDDIQALKAGIMEIADIFVINKADREGVDRTVAEIEMLQKSSEQQEYLPPIVKTIARDDIGIDELLQKVQLHRQYLKESGSLEMNRKKRLKFELHHRINSIISQEISTLFASHNLDEIINDIYNKKTDCYTVADKMISSLLVK
ncbi:MAG: methylmalonyl Co-A mutase-associated GTPase MeaB [Candidatus Cloacimonetes bacterium]|nr:methylmalonyl Co-A mutase-associated GTPase MeaB [Candidatus Cloacimonadota bacterium]